MSVACVAPDSAWTALIGLVSTVAVALWVMQDEEVHPTLELVVDGAVDGGVGPVSTNNPGWSRR